MGEKIEDKEGLISKAVKVEAGDGRFLVSMTPEKCEVLNIPGVEGLDEYKIVMAAGVFKYLFGTGFNPADIRPEDIYIQVEVPANKFTKEVRLVLESGRGIDFHLSTKEIPKEDEVTKYIPKVVVKDEE